MTGVRHIKRKSSKSGPQGNSVSFVLDEIEGGVRVGDTKPGREGQEKVLSFQKWEQNQENTRKGRFEGMNYVEIGVEWFDEDYAIMPDSEPRFDEVEIDHLLSAVLAGETTIEALTAPPVDAHSVVA